MDTEQQSSTETIQPLVKTFKASSFQLASWQVVSDVRADVDFKPLAYDNVQHERGPIDPLFENYDNDPPPEEPKVTLVEQSLAEELTPSVEEETPQDDQALQEAEEALRVEAERRSQEDAAQAEAQAEAERQAEHTRQIEEARNAGFEQGRAEATKESEERLHAIEQKYSTIIEDMQDQIREGLEGVERRGVDFCLSLTKKLIGASVEVSRDYILEAIQEAIKVTGGATIKAIRVSPQDLEFLNKLNPEKQFKECDGTWSFQADESVRAGCVIETSAGTVEYDIEKTWERIKDSVVKVR
jgi:flagellar assembly protein FliH